MHLQPHPLSGCVYARSRSDYVCLSCNRPYECLDIFSSRFPLRTKISKKLWLSRVPTSIRLMEQKMKFCVSSQLYHLTASRLLSGSGVLRILFRMSHSDPRGYFIMRAVYNRSLFSMIQKIRQINLFSVSMPKSYQGISPR